MSRDNTKARESILEEDLAKNVSLSLHNSFCLNRELKTKGLPNQAARLQEQREWMRSYEQLRAWEEIVISSDDEEALLRQITVSNSSGLSTPVTGKITINVLKYSNYTQGRVSNPSPKHTIYLSEMI